MKKLHNEELGDIDTFVEKHQRLVYLAVNRIIKKIGNRYVYEDLVQEGFIGLLKAYENYDSTKSKFSTFAMHYIRWMIMRYIRDKVHLVKIPRSIYTLAGKIMSENLTQNSVNEISELLRISGDEVQEALTHLTNIKVGTLNKPSNEEMGDEHYIDYIRDSYDNTTLYVNNFIESLDEQRKTIIKLRLQGYKQHEIAKKIGVSQAQVSRIVRKLQAVASEYFMLENEVGAS